MKREIKTRLAVLARGEVPEGYNKTQVGIVPRDWEVKKIGSEFVEYRELSNDIEHMKVYSSSRKGLISQNEYFDKKEAVSTLLGYKVVPHGFATYRHMSDDDIFKFNINRTGMKILVSAEYPVFKASKTSEIDYLISCINEVERFRYFCRMQKLGGTRTRLYYKNLCQYKLPLPPLPEQQKIAAILATQDKVIELKEKLIAEKEQQKKYLMGELLTGRKRLPGFERKWTTVEIGEIFDYLQPTPYLVKSTDYSTAYSVPVLTAGKTFILGYTDEQFGIFEDVPVVIFDDFTTASKYVDFPFKAKSSAMKILVSKPNYSIIFAFHAMQRIRYVIGGHERNWISKYRYMTIDVPNEVEQNAIANILSTADRELDLLRRDLEQEKQKKKALMQLLLTGIVRV